MHIQHRHMKQTNQQTNTNTNTNKQTQTHTQHDHPPQQAYDPPTVLFAATRLPRTNKQTHTSRRGDSLLPRCRSVVHPLTTCPCAPCTAHLPIASRRCQPRFCAPRAACCLLPFLTLMPTWQLLVCRHHAYVAQRAFHNTAPRWRNELQAGLCVYLTALTRQVCRCSASTGRA